MLCGRQGISEPAGNDRLARPGVTALLSERHARKVRSKGAAV